MSLFLVGLNHKTAPIATREQFALSSSRLPLVLNGLRETGAREVVVLSTCNRFEIYALGSEKLDEAITQFLSEFFQLSSTRLQSHLYHRRDREAAHHLFEVACGTDSLVLGESQILGQVKTAFEDARSHNALGGTLDELFRRAITCGKRARSETEIGRGALSVGSAAVELARQIFGSLQGRTVLILGAGKMSELTAQHLVSSGARRIIVSNRTHERACAMARQFNEVEQENGDSPVLSEAVTWDEFPRWLHQADIVISSTRAPHTVISQEQVAHAMKSRRSRPLLLVDIAVPRDIDPQSHRLDNVYLYDIDDLQGVVSENRRQRAGELARVEEVVNEEVFGWSKWMRGLEARPVMAALAARATEISQSEVEIALSRLPGLTDKEQEAVRLLGRAIANKLMHAPLRHLREAAGEGSPDVEALRRAFALEDATRNGATKSEIEYSNGATSANGAMNLREDNDADGVGKANVAAKSGGATNENSGANVNIPMREDGSANAIGSASSRTVHVQVEREE
jgi:glutamyl-tRNA reductase